MKAQVRLFQLSSLLLLLVAGCAGPGKKKSVEDVGDLASRVERVHDTAERAQERVRGSADRFRDLVRPDFDGDAISAYGDFVDAVELSQKEAERLRDELSPMQRAARGVFDQWESDLDGYSSDSIRERSGQRLRATRQRFDAIVKSLEPVLVSLDAFHAAMRDQVLFLEHDLNPDATAAAAPQASRLAEEATRLVAALDVCLATTQAYAASTSLPGGPVVSRADGR